MASPRGGLRERQLAQTQSININKFSIFMITKSTCALASSMTNTVTFGLWYIHSPTEEGPYTLVCVPCSLYIQSKHEPHIVEMEKHTLLVLGWGGVDWVCFNRGWDRRSEIWEWQYYRTPGHLETSQLPQLMSSSVPGSVCACWGNRGGMQEKK